MGYPATPSHTHQPAETWTAPGAPSPILDPDGHPLTWGRVTAAHTSLASHASCSFLGAAGFDSSDEEEGESPRPCPCQWHDALIDELEYDRSVVHLWPGPICGSCWAASCSCGYVFQTPSEAAGREVNGRLVCHSQACAPRMTQAPLI